MRLSYFHRRQYQWIKSGKMALYFRVGCTYNEKWKIKIITLVGWFKMYLQTKKSLFLGLLDQKCKKENKKFPFIKLNLLFS